MRSGHRPKERPFCRYPPLPTVAPFNLPASYFVVWDFFESEHEEPAEGIGAPRVCSPSWASYTDYRLILRKIVQWIEDPFPLSFCWDGVCSTMWTKTPRRVVIWLAMCTVALTTGLSSGRSRCGKHNTVPMPLDTCSSYGFCLRQPLTECFPKIFISLCQDIHPEISPLSCRSVRLCLRARAQIDCTSSQTEHVTDAESSPQKGVCGATIFQGIGERAKRAWTA